MDFVEWLEYAEFYPSYGEEGYKRENNGGKGMKPDAPEWAVKKYKEYLEDKKKGIFR